MINLEQRRHIETNPAFVVCKLPQALYYGELIVYKDITESAVAGLPIFPEPIPWKIEVMKVSALCKATNGSGTARIYDASGNAISDAITMDAVDARKEDTTLDITYSTIAKDSQLIVKTNGSGDRGTIAVSFRIIGD